MVNHQYITLKIQPLRKVDDVPTKTRYGLMSRTEDFTVECLSYRLQHEDVAPRDYRRSWQQESLGSSQWLIAEISLNAACARLKPSGNSRGYTRAGERENKATDISEIALFVVLWK